MSADMDEVFRDENDQRQRMDWQDQQAEKERDIYLAEAGISVLLEKAQTEMLKERDIRMLAQYIRMLRA